MTLITSQLQCRLCPALVATAGGDLALLEEHLHSLHRVAGAGHLQLARAVTLLSRGEVATILAKLGPRLTLLTTTGLLDYNITLIDDDIDDDEEEECSDSDEEQVEDTHIGDTITGLKQVIQKQIDKRQEEEIPSVAIADENVDRPTDLPEVIDNDSGKEANESNTEKVK